MSADVTIRSAFRDGSPTGTALRSVGSWESRAAGRDELPTFVDNHEMRDPAISHRVPVGDTEPKPMNPAADSPTTDVGGISQSANRTISPVFEVGPWKKVFQQRSQVLQQWEGTVVELGEGSFGARMKNLTDPAGPEEWATILLGEISEDERDRVQLGAIFYWSVGYLIEPYGQRRTASTIYFRSLPAWSKGDLDRARVAADFYSDVLLDGSSD